KYPVATFYRDFVSASFQFLHHFGGKAWLERYAASTCDAPAWRIGRSLGVLTIEQHAQRHLHVTLMLHGASHHAERHLGRSVGVHGEGGDDRMRRSLAWSDLVRVPGSQGKARAAILQADPCAGNHNARTKAHVVGL